MERFPNTSRIRPRSTNTFGKKKKAQQMLAEIYDWFTEGFDTADLKDEETKALLDEFV